MAKKFYFNTSTFETISTCFIQFIASSIYEKLVTTLAGHSLIIELIAKIKTFTYFYRKIHATDITL